MRKLRIIKIVLMLSIIFILFFIFWFAHRCPFLSKSTPVVRISTGHIQGWVGYSLRSGKEFWQFLSIPFAEPPLGKLRFEPPQPIKSWDGVKQVIRYPPLCFQFDAIGFHKVLGEEDCLFLNVFVSTPDKSIIRKPNRPVLVFIYGGGFIAGGSVHYHPDFFMDQDDIVLVTFNYRLGPFGFLNLAEPDNHSRSNLRLPRGNMGLKDQLLVLRWVNENIKFFGGDPKKVTIYGESAGAASVHYHMLSEKSKGLFRKAVSFSGSVLNPWAFTSDITNISRNYAHLMKCLDEDKDKLLECLVKADATTMVKLQKKLADITSEEEDVLRPSVEMVKTEDTFLNQHPLQIIREGNTPKIPWILGVNSGEGGLLTARFEFQPEKVPVMDKNWVPFMTSFCGLEDKLLPHMAEKIRNFYFGSNASFDSFEREKFLQIITRLGSDILFYRGVHSSAVGNVLNGAPTYLFYFNYTAVIAPSMYSYFCAITPRDWIYPELKFMLVTIYQWLVERLLGEDKGPRRFGVSHGDDLLQTWNMMGFFGYLSFGDEAFSDSLVKTIVEFVREDDGESPPKFRGLPWTPILASDIPRNASYETLPTMLMDNTGTPKIIREPYKESLKFWGTLLDKQNV